MKRQKVRLVNLSGIGCRSTSKIDLQASMKVHQDFPGKVTHSRQVLFFYSRSLSGTSRRKTQQWAELPKAKAKAAAKIKKNRKMCWGVRQRIDRQLFKLRFEAIANVFFIKAGTCIKKRKPSFQHDAWQSLVWQRLLYSKSASAWSSASTSRFHKGIFFFSWQSGTLSFFFVKLVKHPEEVYDSKTKRIGI